MNTASKNGVTLLLKSGICLIGIMTLVWLLWFPQVEGVNANATSFTDIYFDDPFLAYVYVAFLTFFAGLYQAFKIVGYMEEQKLFSDMTVNALHTLQYNVFAFIAFMAGAIVWIGMMARATKDDGAGAIALGIIVIVASAIVATAVGMFRWYVQKAL